MQLNTAADAVPHDPVLGDADHGLRWIYTRQRPAGSPFGKFNQLFTTARTGYQNLAILADLLVDQAGRHGVQSFVTGRDFADIIFIDR